MSEDVFGMKTPTAKDVNLAGKTRAQFFASVRERGLLNTTLNESDQLYKDKHPEQATKWEYAPPSGDNTLVIAREAMGYRVVDASELGGSTESSQKSGPVRRGDLILMAAPREIHEAVLAQDARAASDDLKSPETAYYEQVNKNTVVTKSGGVDRAVPTGSIRRTVEMAAPKQTAAGDIEPPSGLFNNGE